MLREQRPLRLFLFYLFCAEQETLRKPLLPRFKRRFGSSGSAKGVKMTQQKHISRLVISAFNYISFINPLQIKKMAMAEQDLYSAIDVLFEGNDFFSIRKVIFAAKTGNQWQTWRKNVLDNWKFIKMLSIYHKNKPKNVLPSLCELILILKKGSVPECEVKPSSMTLKTVLHWSQPTEYLLFFIHRKTFFWNSGRWW